MIFISCWPKFSELCYQSIYVAFTNFRPSENKNKPSCCTSVVVRFIHHNVDAAISPRTCALLVLLVIGRFYGITRSDSIGCLHDNFLDTWIWFFLFIDFLPRRECITYFKTLKLHLIKSHCSASSANEQLCYSYFAKSKLRVVFCFFNAIRNIELTFYDLGHFNYW